MNKRAHSWRAESIKSFSSATWARIPRRAPCHRAAAWRICGSPPPKAGATSKAASSRSAPNGTASRFSGGWRRLPANTCARARRSILRGACAPASGRTSRAMSAIRPRSSATRCRCSAAVAVPEPGPAHRERERRRDPPAPRRASPCRNTRARALGARAVARAASGKISTTTSRSRGMGRKAPGGAFGERPLYPFDLGRAGAASTRSPQARKAPGLEVRRRSPEAGPRL
jgi:hypothetical protein